MAYNHTPTTLLVWSFLSKGQGLAINPELLAQIDTFNTDNLSGAVQSNIDAIDDQVLAELKKLPGFLTGISNTSNKIASDIKSRGLEVFGSNPGQFLLVFSQVESFIISLLDEYKSLKNVENKSYNDFGFTYTNYTDLVTSGISNQFDLARFPDLLDEMTKWGTLFRLKDLRNFYKPSALCSNLVDQGFGYIDEINSVVNLLSNDIDDIEPDVEFIILEKLAQIKNNDLNDIIKATEFRPAKRIENLSQVLKAEFILSENALLACRAGNTLEILANSFSNIGGRFDYAKDLVDFYRSLNLRPSGSLDQLTNPMPAEEVQELRSILVPGTGPDQFIWMLDMLSSVSGHGYIDDLAQLNSIGAEFFENYNSIKLLVAELNRSGGDPLIVNSLVSLVNAEIASDTNLQIGNTAFANINSRFDLELYLFAQSNITLGIEPSKLSLSSFARNFQDLDLTANQTGSIYIINSLLTSDLAGDAIKSCMYEGLNNRLFARRGIKPNTIL